MTNGSRPSALELKVELQSYGLQAPGSTSARAGGAGPADGLTLFIDDLVASVPTGAPYVERSPYSLRAGGETCDIVKGGIAVGEARLAPDPEYYSLETPAGVSLRKIALRHGSDGIGSTVAHGCAHGADACRFCAISVSSGSGATLANKNGEDIAFAAGAAEGEGYSHMVLTTGSTGSDMGIRHISGCAARVRERTSMRVHVQFEPPGDAALIEHAAGVSDTVAINMECFDPGVLARIAPAKARAGLGRYKSAWRKAVDAYGPGQVTCFVILGLGESDESVLEGTRVLSSEGVYPFLVPLRPLRGTPMESWSPPEPARVMRLFERAARIVEEAGLRASDCIAGCVRCGACTAFTDWA